MYTIRLFLLTISMSIPAFADDGQNKAVCCRPPEQKPKIIYKTQWKTKIVEKKVDHPVPVPVAVKEPCCEKKPDTHYQRAQTGNQKVIINIPKQQDRVIQVIKYRTRTKIEKVEVPEINPNRLQLLIGQSKTKQEVVQENCCDIKATRVYEPDIGLQYLRDFGGFTGSLIGTKNGSYYLGVGVNW